MIISLVSGYDGGGKTQAACWIELYNHNTAYHLSFMENVRKAVSLFVPNGQPKYEKLPGMDVTPKDLIISIASTLYAHHPELSVANAKNNIIWHVKNGFDVVIDDTRREREFTFLDHVAANHGTLHHVVEVVPVGAALESARLDTWSEGDELCGSAAWPDNRYVLVNDGTDKYELEVIRLWKTL